MNKLFILLAGSPATGKTYLVNILLNKLKKLPVVVAPDKIKESLADLVGFDNLQEKKELEFEVWEKYYQLLDIYMSIGEQIIVTEYPFSHKQKTKLELLIKRYNYFPITIRLISDFDVLWERRYARDRKPDRHLSHLMSHYHYGDSLEDINNADNHISKSEFQKIILERKYNQFQLGKLFEYDVTDFENVDYSRMIHEINSMF